MMFTQDQKEEVLAMLKNMHKEINEQFPNPYKTNTLYEVHYEKFSKNHRYFALKNKRGYIHVYKVIMVDDKISVETFRFNKKLELIIADEFILTKKDEELYEKYLTLLQS